MRLRIFLGAVGVAGCFATCASADVLRDYTYTSGDLSAWTTRYSANEAGNIEEAAPDRLTVVPSPTDPTQNVLKAEVHPGDLVDNGNRAEVYGRKGPSNNYAAWPDPDLSERWYRWSIFFPPTFPSYMDHWQLVTQWRHDGPTGEPEIALVTNKNRMELNVSGHVTPFTLDTGVWDQYQAHIIFSPVAQVGLVELWRNGEQIVSEHAATEKCCAMQAGLSVGVPGFLKMGLYRDPATPDISYVYDGPMRVASDAASVGL